VAIDPAAGPRVENVIAGVALDSHAESGGGDGEIELILNLRRDYGFAASPDLPLAEARSDKDTACYAAQRLQQDGVAILIEPQRLAVAAGIGADTEELVAGMRGAYQEGQAVAVLLQVECAGYAKSVGSGTGVRAGYRERRGWRDTVGGGREENVREDGREAHTDRLTRNGNRGEDPFAFAGLVRGRR